MNTNKRCGTRVVRVMLVAALGALSACSSSVSSSVERSEASLVPIHGGTMTAPGVVQYVWEEPMVDVIEVPPGLDPEGIYYRPAHREVVEIRQGRYQYRKE